MLGLSDALKQARKNKVAIGHFNIAVRSKRAPDQRGVQILKAINPDILVEGEIGDIGTGSEIHDAAPDLSKGLTAPDEASEFVESTKVDRHPGPGRRQHARHAEEHGPRTDAATPGYPAYHRDQACGGRAADPAWPVRHRG